MFDVFTWPLIISMVVNFVAIYLLIKAVIARDELEKELDELENQLKDE